LRAAVAQVVERSPEKAGVGGSTPSRGTTTSTTYSEQEQNPVTSCHKTNSGAAEVCLSLSSVNSKHWGQNPQPPRSQISPDTDSSEGEESKGGGS
jgi:hypothetical protein